jgi:thiol peroxidase
MATTALKGNPATTNGSLPEKGQTAPALTAVAADLSEATLETFSGKKKVLNIFPSIDTGVCAASVRRFNQEAANLENTVVLCISKDLPFALKRFCGAEGIENVESLSAFRSSFASDYGVELQDTGLKGLCARAVVVLDENNVVLHSELVSEITEEPDYSAALAAL